MAAAQVASVFGDVAAVGLVEYEQRIAAGGVGDRGDGEVGAGKWYFWDVEVLRGENCAVFGGEGDIVASNAAVGHLCVEVVRVSEGCVGHDVWNGD